MIFLGVLGACLALWMAGRAQRKQDEEMAAWEAEYKTKMRRLRTEREIEERGFD